MLSGPLWAAEIHVINGDADFAEGPFWADGKLYYAEYGGNRVSVWDGATNRVLWTQDGCGPSAVMPFAGGWLVTCYDNGTYVKIGADGETERGLGSGLDRGGAHGPERRDLRRERRRLPHRIRPLGERPDPRQSLPPRGQRRADAGCGRPALRQRHPALGRRQSCSNESEAGRVITFAVQEDGSLADRRLLVRLTAMDEPVDAYPDGIKLGPDGNLYIGQYSSGRVVVITPDGKLVRKLEVPSPAAPNIAFGPDGTVYVMAVDDQQNPPLQGQGLRHRQPVIRVGGASLSPGRRQA